METANSIRSPESRITVGLGRLVRRVPCAHQLPPFKLHISFLRRAPCVGKVASGRKWGEKCGGQVFQTYPEYWETPALSLGRVPAKAVSWFCKKPLSPSSPCEPENSTLSPSSKTYRTLVSEQQHHVLWWWLQVTRISKSSKTQKLLRVFIYIYIYYYPSWHQVTADLTEGDLLVIAKQPQD